MSINQALHASVDRRMRGESAKILAFSLAFLASSVFFCTVSGSAHAQDATNPSAADYVAAKNRVAMARVDAELAKIQRDAKGEGSREQAQGGGTPVPLGGYVQPLVRQAPPAEPTVLRVKADSDGKLIAMIALGNGTVIPAWAGKSIGRGTLVQSVTTSDVIVKDGAGVHPLAWGDGSTAASTSQGYSAPAVGYPGGVGLVPPPVAGN